MPAPVLGAARWALVFALLLGLASLFPDDVGRTAGFVLASLLQMAPIIALAVLLTGSIQATGADKLLARAFEGRMTSMILLASLLGAVTPVCGVGVLPFIAGLLGAGVPLAPIMAFWLSSPITDPAMIVVTAGTLGPAFAAGKTASAFAIGLAGGLATEAMVQRGAFRQALKSSAAAASAGTPCGGDRTIVWTFWMDRSRRDAFIREIGHSGLVIAKWLTIAFALESLVRDHLSPEIIAEVVGRGSTWAVPLAVLVGIPIYLDGYAALPLVRGLMELGMTPGAAMAFMVAGGITSLYASVAVFALVRLPVFLWYLGLATMGSLASGYAYDLLATAQAPQ